MNDREVERNNGRTDFSPIPSKLSFHTEKKSDSSLPDIYKALIPFWLLNWVSITRVVARFPQASLSRPAATVANSETPYVCYCPSDPPKLCRQLGFYSQRRLKHFAAPWPFCVALSHSVHWHTRFYTWASKNLLKQFPLFWRTWTQARASTRPQMLAWQMSRDYSDCRASELTDRQLGFFLDF